MSISRQQEIGGIEAFATIVSILSHNGGLTMLMIYLIPFYLIRRSQLLPPIEKIKKICEIWIYIHFN